LKYLNYDNITGKILGWYDDEVHGIYTPGIPEVLSESGDIIAPAVEASYDISSIPTPNVSMTNVDWQTAIDKGYTYFDGTVCSSKDFRSIEDLRIDYTNKMKQHYESANELDIDYLGTTFQADNDSQDLIVKVLSAGDVPVGFFWLDVTNKQVPMTYLELQRLSGVILSRNQLNFIKYQSLKYNVSIALSVTELDLVVW